MSIQIGNKFYEGSNRSVGPNDTFVRAHNWPGGEAGTDYVKELYDPKIGSSRLRLEYVPYDRSHGDLQELLREGKVKNHPRIEGRYILKGGLAGTTKRLYHILEVLKAIKDGKWVLIFEGEKDAETCMTFELAAREPGAAPEFGMTTMPGGASDFSPHPLKEIYGPDVNVAIFQDNDEAGETYARNVATALYGRVNRIKIIKLFSMDDEADHKKDFTDWVERAQSNEAEPHEIIGSIHDLIWRAPDWRPTYRTDSVVESDIAEEVADLLGRERLVFRYAGMPVIATHAETGARFKEADGSRTYEQLLTFKPTNEPIIKNAIEKVTSWEGRRGGNGEIVSKKVPDWVVKNVSQAQVWALPYLAGFVRHPLLTDEGLVSRSDGYDDSLKLYWDSKDLEIVEFKGTPREALEFYCNKVLSGFPYKTEHDMYRALAFPATLLTRKTKIDDGQSPCFMFGAEEAHSFKTLSVEMQFRIVTGRRVAMRPYPSGEEEVYKSFTAGICSDPEVMYYDNIRNGTSFGNPLIEMFLTSGRATIRPFGQNVAEREVSSSALIVASQNRPSFETGDMYTRTCMAKLERNGPVDDAWIDEAVRASKEDRGVLLGALAKILEAEPAENIHNCRFKDWWAAVGGRICTAAEDLDIFKSLSDPSDVPNPKADAIRDVAIEMFHLMHSAETGRHDSIREAARSRGMFTWSELVEVCGEVMEESILALMRKTELPSGLNNNHAKVLSKEDGTKVKLPDGRVCRFTKGRFKDSKGRGDKNGYFLRFVDGPENVAM